MFGWSKPTPDETWDSYVPRWLSSGRVRGGMVGPYFQVSKEHRLCEHFARKHPNSETFLIAKLADPNALLAAYAFKCMTRVAEPKYDELPQEAINRTDRIEVQQSGCMQETQTLRQFIRNYFEIEDPDDGFLDDD